MSDYYETFELDMDTTAYRIGPSTRKENMAETYDSGMEMQDRPSDREHEKTLENFKAQSERLALRRENLLSELKDVEIQLAGFNAGIKAMVPNKIEKAMPEPDGRPGY